MSLDFLLKNMCKTYKYMHFRVEAFVKIYVKNILSFKLRECINVYVNFSLKTYIKH